MYVKRRVILAWLDSKDFFLANLSILAVLFGEKKPSLWAFFDPVNDMFWSGNFELDQV